MLTEQQIAELRRLLEAATPGPLTPTTEPRGESWPGLYQVCNMGDVLTYGYDGEEGIYCDNPHDIALWAALRNAAPALLSAHDDAVRLRVEADMLHYAFHHLGESWMPKRDTYGQWKNDLYRLMVERRYWTNGVPEYAALRPAEQASPLAGEGEDDGDWNEGVRLSGKTD